MPARPPLQIVMQFPAPSVQAQIDFASQPALFGRTPTINIGDEQVRSPRCRFHAEVCGDLQSAAVSDVEPPVRGRDGKEDIDIVAVRMVAGHEMIARLPERFELGNIQQRIDAIEPLDVVNKSAQNVGRQRCGDTQPCCILVLPGRRIGNRHHASEEPPVGYGMTTSGTPRPRTSVSRSIRDRRPAWPPGRGAPITTRSKSDSLLVSIRQVSSRPCLEPALYSIPRNRASRLTRLRCVKISFSIVAST